MENLIEEEVRRQAENSYQSTKSVQDIVVIERDMRLAMDIYPQTNTQIEGAAPDGRFIPISSFNPVSVSG